MTGREQKTEGVGKKQKGWEGGGRKNTKKKHNVIFLKINFV